MALLKGGSQDDLTLKYLLQNVQGGEVDLSGIQSQIDDINAELGDTPLPTTAQTITGAIAEHETDISASGEQTFTVTLPYANWTLLSGETNVYSQTITVTGGTAKTKVALQPSYSVLQQMLTDGTLGLYIENDNATFKAIALGSAPTVNLTIQASKKETL